MQKFYKDLHDELGSNLAAIKMSLHAFTIHNDLPDEKFAQIISMINTASEDMRRIAHNLMPPEFNHTMLPDVIAAHISRLNKTGDQFQFTVSGYAGYFTKQQDLFIYRIVLELTNNIIRHTAATEAGIQLVYYTGYLGIVAEDNGVGFSNNPTAGIGLKNIRSRVSYLYGDISIDTNEYGTTILIKIPYAPPYHD